MTKRIFVICSFCAFALVKLAVQFICQIVGDITKASTLVPEYFKGVKMVINAISVIVGPKEGDTPDRAKYSQVLINS